MILYRFVHSKFAGELSGIGAKRYGGRWNPVGIPVIYTSETISLALLEVLANALTLDELQLFRLMEIHVPSDAPHQEVLLRKLKKNWLSDFDYTQWMGMQILSAKESLLVQCPSAIINRENNYLINPEHPDFEKVKMHIVNDFHFDPRLFKPSQVSSLVP